MQERLEENEVFPDAQLEDEDEYVEEERLARRTPDERLAIWQQHQAASSRAQPQEQQHQDERLAKRARGEPTLQNAWMQSGISTLASRNKCRAWSTDKSASKMKFEHIRKQWPDSRRSSSRTAKSW
eukprot:2989672-Amphidinium_carterae.1